MSIIRSRKAPQPPAFEVVRELAYHPIHDGWIWRECVVRLTDGTLDVYEIPQYRLGGAR